MQRTKLYFEATAIVPERKSGIGHVVLELLHELDKDEYTKRYEIIAFVPYGEGIALKRYVFKNVKVKQLPFPHKVLSLLSRMQYGLPIDVFIGKGSYIFPNYRNFNLLFSKSLTFIHDVAYLLYPEYTQPRNLVYLQKNIHKWLTRTDRILTISQSSKKEIIEQLNIKSTNVSVVDLGVDDTVFYPRTNNEVREVKDKYNLKGEYYLYIGSIEPRKNLSFLVNAYASNTKLRPYTLFLVGGDGWLNEEIQKDIDQARKNGCSVFRNDKYVIDNDLPALMTGAKGLFLPSHHEGFGLSAVQAEACGTSVIASDIPVLREIGKERFIFFNNNNKDSFNEAIEKTMVSKPNKPYIRSTWQKTAEGLLQFEGETKEKLHGV